MTTLAPEQTPSHAEMAAQSYEALVTRNRPEFTHHPFISWQTGKPVGYFDRADLAHPVALKQSFQEHGFLVLENAFSPAEIDALNAETVATSGLMSCVGSKSGGVLSMSLTGDAGTINDGDSPFLGDASFATFSLGATVV